MAGFDRARLLRAVIDGVAGRRALFFPGWSGIEPTALPANFHVVGPLPHQRLFPRTALVVHHGGAGTSHTAARAGVPSVVVPFAADQPFWADRLRRVGVAPPTVMGQKLDGASLCRQIDAALQPAMQARARALGAAMAAEDGVADAVATLQAWLGRPAHHAYGGPQR